MEQRELTCIECPRGCSLVVTMENGVAVDVKGNFCPRGKKYAEKEVVSPERVVTSTVRAKNGSMISVKTNKPVKKSHVFDVMDKIKVATCETPIKIGDIIIKNIDGDADLVATCNSD